MITEETRILQARASGIPAEMKQARRWVCWAAVPKPRKDGTVQLTKEPRRADQPSRKASSTDPSTWSDFDTALAAVQDGMTTGIGFVLGDGWAGIDIDNAIAGDPPSVTAEASEVISAFHSYTEFSPSGTGIHIIVHGDVTGGRKVGNIEMYSAGRYFTVTGHELPTGSFFVENCQEQLNDLALELDKRRAREGRAARNTTSSASLAAQAPGATPPLPPPASEEAIIERAHRVCHGFPELWVGDTAKYDGDASRADLALAGSLVFMCGRDQHPLVESLMRRSALVRDKWDDHRTYISRTIQRAYEGRDDDSFFDWNRQNRALAVIAAGNEELTSGDPNDHDLPLDLTRETTLDDIGFARRLAAESFCRIRYVHTWQKWIYWDGRRWKLDDGAAAIQEAQRLRDQLWREFAALPNEQKTVQALRFIKACGAAKHIQNIVGLTKSQQAVRITHEELDRHPYLLNVRNGTIDLQNGLFREHQQEDFITQVAEVDYDPEARAQRWEDFVHEAMQDDPELVRFLQVSAGVMLSGDVSMQSLWCHYGNGGNGKSTFLGSIAKMLGDYVASAPADFLMMKQGNSHPTELALLYGKRLVLAIECEGGRRLREAFVKLITGGDTVTARRMCEDFWYMNPTWHVHVSFNDPPTINGTDDGIRRRLKIIPWRASFKGAQQDSTLKTRLESEEFRAGILNWCLAGMRDFLANGMPLAMAVTEATDEYVAGQDLLGGFLEECCELYPGKQCFFDEFMKAFHAWLEARGENVFMWTGKRLGNELKRRGHMSFRSMSGRDRGRTAYRDVGLAAAAQRFLNN